MTIGGWTLDLSPFHFEDSNNGHHKHTDDQGDHVHGCRRYRHFGVTSGLSAIRTLPAAAISTSGSVVLEKMAFTVTCLPSTRSRSNSLKTRLRRHFRDYFRSWLAVIHPEPRIKPPDRRSAFLNSACVGVVTSRSLKDHQTPSPGRSAARERSYLDE